MTGLPRPRIYINAACFTVTPRTFNESKRCGNSTALRNQYFTGYSMYSRLKPLVATAAPTFAAHAQETVRNAGQSADPHDLGEAHDA